MKTGDLAGGWVSQGRALEGIREHTRVQSLRPENYRKEVSVIYSARSHGISLDVYGRIDGIFNEPDHLVVEEIKTCRSSARHMADTPSLMHLAQLKCYAFMIASQEKKERITLQLTYVQLGTQSEASYKETPEIQALESFFMALVASYIRQIRQDRGWAAIRNRSLVDLPFPYPDFRDNQRLFAESVYKIIKNEKILFARAPTGTGKTIATLFPAVKSLGLGQVDKIFFLTAKTVGRTVAQKAISDMRQAGARLKSIVITAKQKICFSGDDVCDMETCPYAKGYYTRLNSALPDIRAQENYDREQIETLARRFELCPFELSLDISMQCDIVVCDLNYCFDPRVYLRRYFDDSRLKCAFLIDEAHNLQDRLRDMYSARILKSQVLDIHHTLKDPLPTLARSLVEINKALQQLTAECRDQPGPALILDKLPERLITALGDFAARADLWLEINRQPSELRTALMEFYFTASGFLSAAGFIDDHYTVFAELKGESDLAVNICCVDPSSIFSHLLERCRACVMFSATLHPVEYHQQLLLGDTASPFSIALPSCFPREHLGLFIHTGIETTYHKRSAFYDDIAELILEVIQVRKGNYMVYFPSYAYLNAVFKCVQSRQPEADGFRIQHRDMTEEQRQEFMDAFGRGTPVTGFAVMGGIFGEGIDLTGDRLIGAMIISPGVPQITPERDLVREYYDDFEDSGFFKAYQMPGFNRVMQAAGRVIRTETDRGIVILVDRRFARNDYRCLFPLEWHDPVLAVNTHELIGQLQAFWKMSIAKKNEN